MESNTGISCTKPSFTILNRAMKYVYYELLNYLNLLHALKYCFEKWFFFKTSDMKAKAVVFCIIQLEGITLRIIFPSISPGSLKMVSCAMNN